MSTSNEKDLTDCDEKFPTNLKLRIKCEEENLEVLSKQYTEMKRVSSNRFNEKDYEKVDLLNEKQKNNKLNEEAQKQYAAKAGMCIFVFLISLVIAFFVLSTIIPNVVPKADIGLVSVVIGISTGIITAIIFVVDDNLKTQRLSEMIAAKRFEMKMKRSKVLSLMQQDAYEGGTDNSSHAKTDDNTGGNHLIDSIIDQAKKDSEKLRDVDRNADRLEPTKK